MVKICALPVNNDFFGKQIGLWKFGKDMLECKNVPHISAEKEKKAENTRVFGETTKTGRAKGLEPQAAEKQAPADGLAARAGAMTVYVCAARAFLSRGIFKKRKMYGKASRLPIKESSGRLRKIFTSQYFAVKSAQNEEGRNRFAIIISNSAVKKSARRHFWKRRIADRLRLWPNFQSDFLLIVSPNIEKIDAEILKTEINQVLQILNPKS